MVCLYEWTVQGREDKNGLNEKSEWERTRRRRSEKEENGSQCSVTLPRYSLTPASNLEYFPDAAHEFSDPYLRSQSRILSATSCPFRPARSHSLSHSAGLSQSPLLPPQPVQSSPAPTLLRLLSPTLPASSTCAPTHVLRASAMLPSYAFRCLLTSFLFLLACSTVRLRDCCTLTATTPSPLSLSLLI